MFVDGIYPIMAGSCASTPSRKNPNTHSPSRNLPKKFGRFGVITTVAHGKSLVGTKLFVSPVDADCSTYFG